MWFGHVRLLQSITKGSYGKVARAFLPLDESEESMNNESMPKRKWFG